MIHALSKQVNGITYSISENMELLSVVFLLSDFYYVKYPYLKSNYKNEYNDKIDKYFSQYKSHPVFAKFKELEPRGFNFDAPMCVLLCDENMGINTRDIAEVKNRLEGIDISEINNFLISLNDFSIETNFTSFFRSNFEVYNTVLDLNLNKLPKQDFKQIFKEYYGTANKNIEVILATTMGGVGFCINGNQKTNIVLGTFSSENEIPIVIDNNSFVEMMLHENSHSYVNHIIEEMDSLEAIDELSNKMYSSLAHGYQEQYGNGQSLLSEEIVRALTVRLLSKYFSKDYGSEKMKSEKKNGFIGVEPICNFLKSYEANRNKYATIESFLNEMILELINVMS